MILDKNLVFSDSIAVTATADSDVVDLGVGRDMGIGLQNIFLEVTIMEAFLTATSVNFMFKGAPDNGSGAEGSYVIYAESGAIAIASLTVGAKVLRIPVPAALANAKPRFYKMTYTVAGSNATAGKVHAALIPDRQANLAYAPGVTAFL